MRFQILTCAALALLATPGCGGSGGGSSSSGSSAAATTSASTAPASSGSTTTAPPGGGTSSALPANATLTTIARPRQALNVVSDLTVFDGKLWLFESANPLQSFGAQIWTYDDTLTFNQVLDDPTSQGFLRGRVFGNRLYVPDGDPNGLAPGIVYVFEQGQASPKATVVEESVHNFDVVELGGALYTSSGLASGESALNRFNPLTDRWEVSSRGPFSRLKYMGVLDGAILASKRTFGASTADFVQIDAAGAQTGLSLFQGVEALTVCIEPLRGALYMTLSAPGGAVAHVRVESGLQVTTLTGLQGAFLFDYVEHSDGNVYAVGTDFAANSYVYGSTDGVDFQRLVEVSDLRFGQVPGNADGRPSLASFQGKLFFGSSTNGNLYRLD